MGVILEDKKMKNIRRKGAKEIQFSLWVLNRPKRRSNSNYANVMSSLMSSLVLITSHVHPKFFFMNTDFIISIHPWTEKNAWKHI